MRRFFDFKCSNDHVTEHYIDSEIREIPCPLCGAPAVRLISAPRAKLDATSGDFPGATMQWERKREEKMKVERQKMRDHGTYK